VHRGTSVSARVSPNHKQSSSRSGGIESSFPDLHTHTYLTFALLARAPLPIVLADARPSALPAQARLPIVLADPFPPNSLHHLRSPFFLSLKISQTTSPTLRALERRRPPHQIGALVRRRYHEV
jgi:hypothetical protein